MASAKRYQTNKQLSADKTVESPAAAPAVDQAEEAPSALANLTRRLTATLSSLIGLTEGGDGGGDGERDPERPAPAAPPRERGSVVRSDEVQGDPAAAPHPRAEARLAQEDDLGC